jgi:hypothetical protein
MKQNSSIVFHLTANFLKIRYRAGAFAAFVATAFLIISASAAELPKPAPALDAAKGFRPAQLDLTAIFLQIADRLEQHGSPVPYLLHIEAEHSRVGAKFRQLRGVEMPNHLPSYVNQEFLSKAAKNWGFLAPKLDLKPLATEIGRLMRVAIESTNGNEPLAANVLKAHQERVIASMIGTAAPTDFESLRKDFRLKLDSAKASQQPDIQATLKIQETLERLSQTIGQRLNPSDAEKVSAVISSIISDVGKMAQAELEIAIVEGSLRDAATAKQYAAASETRLSVAEQKMFSELLKKERFTKSDFPALESFYKSPAYGKLSEQGKDELSRRVWNGTRKK